MNFASRLSIEDRALFERTAARIVGIGAAAGILWAPFRKDPASTWLLVLGSVAVATLLGASSIRGRDDTLPVVTRVLCGVVAGAIGLCLESLGAAVVATGAFAGLAMAGPSGTPTRRHVVGALGGAAGIGWALWILPTLLQQFHAAPRTALGVVSAVASAALFSLGFIAPLLRLHVDSLAAKLEAMPGEAGQRLHRTWTRCHLALGRAPKVARGELLRLLDGLVREAQRMLSNLDTLDQRLASANPADAEAQLKQLQAELAEARDPVTRERLQSAAASLSDSLEHLQTLARKRERFGAELKLKLAMLERAALALETAQGEPDELHAVALRLSAP